MANVVEAQQRLHEVVEERLNKNGERQRQAEEGGECFRGTATAAQGS